VLGSASERHWPFVRLAATVPFAAEQQPTVILMRADNRGSGQENNHREKHETMRRMVKTLSRTAVTAAVLAANWVVGAR
jgi:hypothetical protein